MSVLAVRIQSQLETCINIQTLNAVSLMTHQLHYRTCVYCKQLLNS